mgnify:CR=1 FL=1
MKKIFVLAGGFGTRLRSVVSDVPKPLAPVDGKPFLMHLLKNCISQGASEFVLLLHFEAEKIKGMIKKMSANGELDGVKIEAIVEPEPRGTGGSVLHAINVLDLNESVLVINADTWLGGGLSLMNSTKAPAVAAVKSKDCKRYGSLEIENGKVKSFKEKSEVYLEGWINAGMYHLSREHFFDLLPGRYFSLEESVLPRLSNVGKLEAKLLKTEFIDIGVPEDYFRFCKWVKERNEIEL